VSENLLKSERADERRQDAEAAAGVLSSCG
jgi:hypothetical protein